MTKIVGKLSIEQRLLVLFVIFAIGFACYFYFNGSLPFQKEAVNVSEQKEKNGETVIHLKDVTKEEAAKEFPINMTEDEMMETIHKMSHQKVIASQKWGAIPLTPERVKRLLEVVQHNETKYKHASTYKDILERWAAGDFSQIDKDHNTIWDLQGGTIGKATGIATPKEEMAFNEKN